MKLVETSSRNMQAPGGNREMRQSKPRALRLCLVGVGALGSEIAYQLAAIGSSAAKLLESVTLIDPDALEARNIPVSRLFAAALQRNPTLQGQSKVDVVAIESRRAAPHICWIPMFASLEQVGWQDLQDHDVLVTATDNLPSRVYAAYACRLLHLPMLDAGVHGGGASTGRVAFFPTDPTTACYACTLTAATRSATLCALRYDAQGCATLPETALMDQSFQTSTALTRTAEAVLALLEKVAFGGMRAASAVQVQEDAMVPLALTRSNECPFHEPQRHLRTVKAGTPLGAQIGESEVMLLPSPLFDGAVCAECGHTSDQVGLASRWSSLSCERCGTSGSWVPLNVVSAVGKADNVAQYSPDEMLLPSRHLLPVRKRIQRHWIAGTR